MRWLTLPGQIGGAHARAKGRGGTIEEYESSEPGRMQLATHPDAGKLPLNRLPGYVPAGARANVPQGDVVSWKEQLDEHLSDSSAGYCFLVRAVMDSRFMFAARR